MGAGQKLEQGRCMLRTESGGAGSPRATQSGGQHNHEAAGHDIPIPGMSTGWRHHHWGREGRKPAQPPPLGAQLCPVSPSPAAPGGTPSLLALATGGLVLQVLGWGLQGTSGALGQAAAASHLLGLLFPSLLLGKEL